MELSLRGQGLALLIALGMGAALGLGYDLLRPLRRRVGKAGAALLDALFSLLSGAAAFVYAMSAGSGRLGLWALGFCLLGFLAYLHSFSPWVLAFWEGCLEKASTLCRACKKILRKIEFSAKKHFPNVRE